MPNRQAAMGTWWDGYSGQTVVVIDEFYGWLGYDFLLRLLDRYSFAVETKGGSVSFTSKLVIFTSNKPPSEWYRNVQDLSPLLRRLGGRVFQFPDQSGAARQVLEMMIVSYGVSEESLSPELC